MKPIKNILGCTLLAGLMMVAADQVRAAGVVLDGVLYVPLKISVKATAEVDGKHKTITVTEKEIVTALGLSDKATLAVATDTGDVWAIVPPSKLPSEDLTTGGYFTISNNETSLSSKGSTSTQAGLVAVAIYTSPVLDDGVVDPTESENDSADWIELTGSYTLKITSSPPKNGLQKQSDSYSAKDLTGIVYSGGTTGSGIGTVSGSGSGSLPTP